jgi:asparagine synthase (glutamine-hydrolysing)
VLTITDPGRPLPAAVPYWEIDAVAREGLAQPFTGSEDEAAEDLEQLLREVVGLHMLADVPVGALLSGGIDSSLVVSLMQELSSRPIKTFSIGFDAEAFNEAPQARQVARHLGTDHTEAMLTGREVLDVVPSLAEMFDEPLANPSQIPTYLISKIARERVTVALTGDGGDELFAGYNRYLYGERIFRRVAPVPAGFRRLIAAGIGGLSPASWDRVQATAAPLLSRSTRKRHLGEKMHKIRDALVCGSIPEMYRSLVSAWQSPTLLVPGSKEPAPAGMSDDRWTGGWLPWMMLTDQATYLPDDLLAKVDRASMAASLEVRVPLLDHRVVEYSWRLPVRLKVRNGQGKWLLRKILERHVPASLIERPKMGFSVPVAAWLRGPLREWAEELLAVESLRRDGILDPGPIRRGWTQLLSGSNRNGLPLWAVLLFQSWKVRWL